MHSKRLIQLRKILFLMFLITSIALFIISMPTTDEAHIYFFDIGQGDASMITLPNDVEILIDGGPSDVVLEKLGMYIPFYDRTIEYMILTHSHDDHIEGLIEIAKRYRVSVFIYNGIAKGTESLLAVLRQQGTEIITITNAQTLFVSDDARIEILFPDRTLLAKDFDNPNDSSIVSRFVYHDTAILFTGDAPKEVEMYLADKEASINAKIINIGHHGSKTSSDSKFIDIVHPEYGIISVGRNSYGHPHQRTLSTLKKASVIILRTDEEGDIHFTSDGTILERVYP